MRILLWHGWSLEGAGSNAYNAEVARTLRVQGHDVLLVCQEPRPEAFPFVDSWGVIAPDGVPVPTATTAARARGTVTVLRPEIGSVLPVFVVDEYRGSGVRPFADLSDEELEEYLDRNAKALRAAAAWHGSEIVIVGHAVPGAEVARRALGAGAYVAAVHGSELDYAVKLQPRYRRLCREGVLGARAVCVPSGNAGARIAEAVPTAVGKLRVVRPGVDARLFRPRTRRAALEGLADLLADGPNDSRARPAAADRAVATALERRDARALDDLWLSYDHKFPEPAAAAVRALAGPDGPLIGYCGRLVVQKGAELVPVAMSLLDPSARGLMIGSGPCREWIAALVLALDRQDADAVAWLRKESPLRLDVPEHALASSAGLRERVVFTGRLGHRGVAAAVAALDVLVVPSILAEGFGMVAAEAAATGVLPLVARHSGLAEVAEALETAVGRPGLFSYEPGPGAASRIAAGIDRLLGVAQDERSRIRSELRDFVIAEWPWERTARSLLDAADSG